MHLVILLSGDYLVEVDLRTQFSTCQSGLEAAVTDLECLKRAQMAALVQSRRVPKFPKKNARDREAQIDLVGIFGVRDHGYAGRKRSFSPFDPANNQVHISATPNAK